MFTTMFKKLWFNAEVEFSENTNLNNFFHECYFCYNSLKTFLSVKAGCLQDLIEEKLTNLHLLFNLVKKNF